MPPVIAGLAAAAILGAEASVVILPGLTAGGLLTTVLSTGLTMGLQMLLQQKPKGQIQTAQVTARDSNPRRLRVYGRAKLGGYTFALESVGGVFLFTGLVHCEGPIDAYEQRWLNDTLTPIPETDAFGFAGVGPWVSAVSIDSRLGYAPQEYIPVIPGWTTSHRLNGLAYSVVSCGLPPKPEKTFQRVFPNGAPALRVVIRGTPVFDPRAGTTAWSPNAALCIRDYLIRERVDATGRRWRVVPASRIDEASFTAFAALCDEDVPLKAGGTEKRYALNGFYDLNEEPRDVLRRMFATCDAEYVQTPDGKIGIRGGKWEEPTVTLTAGNFHTYQYVQGNAKLSAFNQVKWTFTDTENDYQQVEGDPWDDDDNQEERGEVLTDNVELTMVQSHAQGRRLCKIRTAKMNPRHHLMDCVVKMPALMLLDQRVVRVQLPDIGLNEVFVVNRFKAADDLAAAELDLSSINASAYAWDPATEEGTKPSVAGTAVLTIPAPLPTGVELSILLQAAGYGQYLISGLVASADEPDVDEEYRDRFQLIGRMRLFSNDPDLVAPWQDMGQRDQTSVLGNPIDDGAKYEVEVAYVGMNSQSAWTVPTAITAVADPTPADPPEGFVANGGVGQVMLAWSAPGSTNTYETRLYRALGSTALLTDAAAIRTVVLVPNQAYDWIDAGLAAGTYRYWVTTINGSGVEGTPAGPVNATVT